MPKFIKKQGVNNINTYPSLTTFSSSIQKVQYLSIYVKGELYLKGENINKVIQDHIKEAITILFGDEKAKEYEKYLKSKELTNKIKDG